MERAEWLRLMRHKAEALYDHLSPKYWLTFGLAANETHLEYLQKLLERVPPHSTLLSAACGAGRYDGMLLEAGHDVVGIDQSAGMLARAKEHFPEVRYRKIGLQEIDFRDVFDGAICIDAMEHVSPEDWPRVDRIPIESADPITTPGSVSEIVLENHSISFSTTAIGVPHLIKVSHFPNWTADGAEGPYRAAPSLMVVVPTQEDVVVEFRNTWAENLGWLLTLGALGGLVVYAVLGEVRRRREAAPAG